MNISNVIKIQEESLIEAVKSRAGIWDTTDETYHNRLKKKQMWIDVMDELNLENNAENLKTVRRRWDYLRTAYKRSRPVPSGSNSSSASSKKFQHEQKMSFMQKSCIPRTKNFSSSKTFQLCFDKECDSDELMSSCSTTNIKGECTPAIEEKAEYNLEKQFEIRNKEINATFIHHKPNEDVFAPSNWEIAEDGFLRMLRGELRTLPIHIQRTLRLIILNLVQEEIMRNDIQK